MSDEHAEAEQNETPPPAEVTGADTYDESQISALEGIDGIRLRPAMYIGGTNTVGLHHLVYELLDNAVDEFVNGYATRVTVRINADGSITCSDDGRGIPVGPMPDKNNRSALDVVFTEIHAGGKFNRAAGYKKATGGLHGIGITAVNACSEFLDAEVRRDGHVWTMSFAKGVMTEELSKIGKTDRTGTKVTFKPDATIFDEIAFSYEMLHRRLQDTAFLNAGLKAVLHDERSGQTEEFYYENGLVEFVQYLNRTENSLFPEVVYIAGENEELGIEVRLALQYSGSFSETVRCYGNGVYNSEGGFHLSGFRAALTRTLNTFGKRENAFKDVTPTGDDFREGLAAVLAVSVPDPKFEAQTKIRLLNSEVEGPVASIVGEGLSKYFEEHPSVIKAILDKAKNAAEAREAAKKAREMVRRKTGLTTGGLPEKLRDCRSRELDITELYLVEGDSAGGSADTGRDSNTQAILPLRGKILNVEKAQLVKVLDNNEISAIFKAVGIIPGVETDISKRRYGKLILMTDADVDGSHIRTLLLTFLFRHMRELVKNGCVYIAQPPLYRVQQKKQTRYVQTQEEMMRQLIQLGKADASLRLEDGTVFEGEHLDRLIEMVSRLEQPLETLERRGISLEYLASGFLTKDNLLPRYRVFVGSEQHWLADKAARDEFLAQAEADRGEELHVAEDEHVDGDGAPSETNGDGKGALLQVVDLHEVRDINRALKDLRGLGFAVKDLVAPGNRNGEPYYPLLLENDDSPVQLASLRELLPALRKLGEKGLKLTRFKGLGEMDPPELWETSMDPDKRLLLQVTLDDAAAADEMFRVLMGDHVEPRREFIEKHALDVKNLDV